MVAPYLADNWSWLNRFIGDGVTAPVSERGYQFFPSWVPAEDQRRLAAYTVCASFLDTCNHYWQPALDVEQQRRWREYGDPELFTTQARSAVLGETQTLSIDVPMQAQADGETGDPIPDPQAAAARDWLLDWADKESLTGRLMDAEHDALGLGDAVYVLGWNETQARPRLRVYDPGFYFPDPASQSDDDDFPKTVHLAWEEANPANPAQMLLRRRTWRLIPLVKLFPDNPELQTRTYPWAPDVASAWTVLYWDGVWNLSDVAAGNGLYDLADKRATFTQQEVDLQQDFIPVIHLPNGAPGKQLWGRPVWWPITRLFADIAASDTDAQVGSELYGSGALLDTNGSLGDQTGPGAKWVGDGKFLDMSAGMKAMDAFRESQRDLASVNARMPAEVLGRVKASEVPSGLAVRLAFGPFSSLVRELRLIRTDKMPLIPKFAMRLAQKAGILDAGILPRAELKFGSFLPSDMTEAVTNVTMLWDRPNPLISLETAILMLVNAGAPIEDAHAELKRINREAYARAVLLLDATGSEQAVRALLNQGEWPDIPDASTVLPVPIVTGGA